MAATSPSPARRSRRRRLATAVAVAGLVATASSAHAIVNGTSAAQADHPWMAALTTADGEVFCGGSIVAADRVVTAAHCLEGERPAGVRVRVGATDLDDPAAQVRRVERFRVHPDGETNDLAVLHLAAPFDLSALVQPIAIVDPATRGHLVDDGSPALVTGWGATSEHDEAGTTTLQQASVRVVGDRECDARYGADLERAVMVCANHPDGNDTCYGDSGGPLVVRDPADGRWFLLGVASFGLDACGASAGVYTEVPAFRDFVASGAPTDAVDDAPDQSPDDDGGSDADGGWSDGDGGWSGGDDADLDADAYDRGWDDGFAAGHDAAIAELEGDDGWDDDGWDEGWSDENWSEDGWDDEGLSDDGWDDDGWDW